MYRIESPYSAVSYSVNCLTLGLFLIIHTGGKTHFVSHQFTDATLKQINEMSNKSQQAIAKIKELMTYLGKIPGQRNT